MIVLPPPHPLPSTVEPLNLTARRARNSCFFFKKKNSLGRPLVLYGRMYGVLQTKKSHLLLEPATIVAKNDPLHQSGPGRPCIMWNRFEEFPTYIVSLLSSLRKGVQYKVIAMYFLLSLAYRLERYSEMKKSRRIHHMQVWYPSHPSTPSALDFSRVCTPYIMYSIILNYKNATFSVCVFSILYLSFLHPTFG